MKREQHANCYKAPSFLAALAIACIFITAAMADDSDKAEELFSQGFKAFKAQRYEEAIKYFKAVIEIDPDAAAVHYGLGFIYGELGRYAEAVEAYKQAIRIKPDVADAHNNLSLAYVKSGNHDAALEEYKILEGLDRELANDLLSKINQ